MACESTWMASSLSRPRRTLHRYGNSLNALVELNEACQVWGSTPVQHLGCDYTVKRIIDKDGEVLTKIRACMKDYNPNIVDKFEERRNITVKPAETPWLDAGIEQLYKVEFDQPGIYDWMAASLLMSGLYGARCCR